MQSIFRLPWSTDSLGVENTKDVAGFHKIRTTPIVDIPLLHKLKRKRTDDGADMLHVERDVKRGKLFAADAEPQFPRAEQLDSSVGSNASRQAPTTAAASPQQSLEHDNVDSPDKMALAVRPDDGYPLSAAPLVASTLSPLQQTIEHQFNLEILLKHRELRLIEQELAKCQIALEQLRRCEAIPYPTDELSHHVSAGTGPSLRAASASAQPSAPAPWGVTDGPYTRHYASWLLPDASFDGNMPQTAATIDHNNPCARPSRNSTSAWAKPVKSRAGRESFNPAAASPVAPAPSRNKGGPLVLKRLSDNQYVKLVCTKCHRSDFSSVQGFLNHCRIAHKIDYKSHEAAAQDCGHVLEDHEAALAATAPPPVGSVTKPPVSKPTPPAPIVTTVHPLAQNTFPRPTWKRQRLAYIQALNDQPASVSSQPPVAARLSSASFVASSTTPHLSSHLAKRGMAMDLASVVARLCQKVDIEAEDDEEIDDSQSSISTPRRFSAQNYSGRPSSKKGFGPAGQRPRPAPLSAPLRRDVDSNEIPESPQEHEHELSPNTADSNPGLVSDHDDDDQVSDSEEARSVLGSTANPIHIHQGCGGDHMDLDHIEVEDEHDGVIVRPRGARQEDPQIAGSPSRARAKYGRGAHK